MSEKAPGVRAILVLTGGAGSGKTTVATLLGESLVKASLLYIDATPDQALSLALAPNKPGMSLAQLFSKVDARPDEEASSSVPSVIQHEASIENAENSKAPMPPEHLDQRPNIPVGREAIDWTFSELTVPVGEDSDLLLVGNLPTQLDLRDRDKLAYGLRRLIDGYQAVIIDGEHPLILSLLPHEVVHRLSVVTPEQFDQWRLSSLEEESTSALVLNAYSGEALPPAIEEALQSERLRLLAKIPRYTNDQEREAKMAQHFESALLRLNIPMFPV